MHTHCSLVTAHDVLSNISSKERVTENQITCLGLFGGTFLSFKKRSNWSTDNSNGECTFCNNYFYSAVKQNDLKLKNLLCSLLLGEVKFKSLPNSTAGSYLISASFWKAVMSRSGCWSSRSSTPSRSGLTAILFLLFRKSKEARASWHGTAEVAGNDRC